MKLFSFAVLCLLFFGSCTSPNNELTLDEVLETVKGDSIKAHIAYLADDRLKGRLPGTPEYDLAVKYVVEQYKSLGLEPAGDDGSFLQYVTIRKGVINESESSMTAEGEELVQGEDYYFLADLNADQNTLSGDVIFVGFGIESETLNHRDYEGKSVEGKVVVVVEGAPTDFPASERAHFSNYGTKFETAAKHGAKGVILVNQGRTSIEGLSDRYRARGNTGVVGPDGVSFGRRVFSPELNFVSFFNWANLSKLLGTNPDEFWNDYYENGETLEGVQISVKTATRYTEFKSPNIVGVLKGQALEDEFIVHSAHLDHVGIGRPVKGDSIYNGAHDNASGVASLLEIARLYSKLAERPQRSIIFLMVTAEEMGLLGSDYFTRFPTVDIDNIVANINTDMPTLIAPLLSIEPLGAEHSSIMANVEEAATKLNLEIMDDHMPEQVRFVRSDQYNFIRSGVPALHVKYGLRSMDPDSDLTEKINDYTANVYHKPSDELNELFDFEAGEVYVKLNFLISYSISQQSHRPSWNEGDFFAGE